MAIGHVKDWMRRYTIVLERCKRKFPDADILNIETIIIKKGFTQRIKDRASDRLILVRQWPF